MEISSTFLLYLAEDKEMDKLAQEPRVNFYF